MGLNTRGFVLTQQTTIKEKALGEHQVLLAKIIQLVLDGSVNGPDEVDVPAEQENQEALSLGKKIAKIRQFTTKKGKKDRLEKRWLHPHHRFERNWDR